MDSRARDAASAVEDAATADAGCPRCGEMLAALPPIEPAALNGAAVRRCARCGTRSTEDPARRMVFSCEGCGAPFATDELLPHTDRLCPGCREGEPARPLPDAHAVIATEAEVRAALARRWRFVTAATIAPYLERVTRQLVRRVEGAPEDSRVVLVDDARLRTLALPSGTLLLSTGMLFFLEDEAELVFVLAHEMAHAVSGDAAVRLVRLGFDAVARGSEAPAADAWTHAAEDLARLGYGRKRERDADTRAIDALVAADYDPESACRLLRRLHGAIDKGDPIVAEIAVSHPPPADRLRRIERALWGRMHEGRILRVNREVFRRAASPAALTASLVATGLPAFRSGAEGLPDARRAEPGDMRSHGMLWAIVVLCGLVAATATALFLLGR